MSETTTPTPFDRIVDAGRMSISERWERVRDKSWHIGQCAVAAAISWWLSYDVIGHPRPLFAPIAAVICLGTSYGQRLRRIVELSVGVAIGLFLADVFLEFFGNGAIQIGVVVVLGMTIGFLLNAGTLFVNQIAVQAMVALALVASPGYTFTRWMDALVGGGVALVAATVVPRAPLRRPRERAALVMIRLSELLRAASESAEDGDVERGLALLKDARATDVLIRELQAAADEGLSVIASSPFRRRHRGQVRRMADVVEPLDRALRNARVLVRRVAIANYHHEPVPRAYGVLCEELSQAAADMAEQLSHGEMPTGARDALLKVGAATGRVEHSPVLSAEVLLGQIRSIIVDLLQLTGLGVLEATDSLPRPPD